MKSPQKGSAMMSMIEVRAKDLMQTEVVQLSPEAPVEEAVRTLEEYNVRGAPVVDDAGKLVGMLSLHDIASSEHLREGRLSTRRGERRLAEPLEVADDEDEWIEPSEDYSPETLGRETVADWMRPGVISVAPEASLKEICRVMEKESIHRVLVTERGRLKGIVSTIDVVRFLAREL
jgi:CBS domain-containing protein